MVFVDIYTLSDFWASGRNLSIKSIIIIIIIINIFPHAKIQFH